MVKGPGFTCRTLLLLSMLFTAPTWASEAPASAPPAAVKTVRVLFIP